MSSIARLWRKLLSILTGWRRQTISCAEFEKFILDYLEETLGAEQKAIFERHLAACDLCRDYLASYRQTVALGKAVFASPEAPVPQDVPEELVQAILKARTG